MAKATAQASVGLAGAQQRVGRAATREVLLNDGIHRGFAERRGLTPRRAMWAAAQGRYQSNGSMDQCAIGMDASTPMPAGSSKHQPIYRSASVTQRTDGRMATA
jgi:hypothetical protein